MRSTTSGSSFNPRFYQQPPRLPCRWPRSHASCPPPRQACCLGRKHRNLDLVTGLELPFGPSLPAQNAWTVQFASPIGDLTAGVLDVEIELAMRIAPHELRHSPVQRGRLVMVVGNIRPVMCKNGACENEQPEYQNGKPWSCKFHFALLMYSADPSCRIPHALVERFFVHRSENVFDEIPGRRVRLKPPHELDAGADRLRIHLWIGDDDGQFEIVAIDAMVPLLDARGVGLGRPFLIDPGPRIEADRIDDELIAFPPAGRIAVPCQVRICGKPPSIRPDLAPHTIPLHQLHHLVWKLDELELGGVADESARDPRRVGASERIVPERRRDGARAE